LTEVTAASCRRVENAEDALDDLTYGTRNRYDDRGYGAITA
jgi:hypothetical protein